MSAKRRFWAASGRATRAQDKIFETWTPKEARIIKTLKVGNTFFAKDFIVSKSIFAGRKKECNAQPFYGHMRLENEIFDTDTERSDVYQTLKVSYVFSLGTSSSTSPSLRAARRSATRSRSTTTRGWRTGSSRRTGHASPRKRGLSEPWGRRKTWRT